MKAAQVSDYGQPIEIRDIPVPQAGPGQMVIEVKAAAVNQVDWKIAAGYLKQIPQTMPLTLGCEVAGVVHQVGDGVPFAVGDRVFGTGSLLRNGGYAEYYLAEAREFAPIPASLSFVQAAAIPVALFTALDGVLVHGRVKAGDRVLVLGGAGGVGSAAVQVAKRAGAFVYATASARNRDRLLELGADVAIDYAAPQWPSDVDAIFDAVGGEAAVAAAGALKKGGVLASPAFAPVEGAVIYSIQPDGARLAAYPVESLKVFIDSEYPLARAAEAVAHSQSGRARGKIVLVP